MAQLTERPPITEHDVFTSLDALARCSDVRDLERLIYEARRAARAVYALKLGERRHLSPRLSGIMARVEGNEVFGDPRAGRALEKIRELVACLTWNANEYSKRYA